MTSVYMHRVTPFATNTIWSQDYTDELWPVKGRTLSEFESFVNAWSAAETMGWGCIRAISTLVDGDATVAGFATFNRLDDAWTPSGTTAVESGTYLLQRYRKKGLNAKVKALAVTFALTELEAQYVLYAVPNSNQPALCSLRRILDPYALANDSDVLAQMVRDEHLFLKWLRHREWKEGENFTLFAISSETAKACHLLNPDGNDRHFSSKQKDTHQNE